MNKTNKVKTMLASIFIKEVNSWNSAIEAGKSVNYSNENDNINDDSSRNMNSLPFNADIDVFRESNSELRTGDCFR